LSTKLRRAKVTDVSGRTPLNKTSTLEFLAKVEELAPLIEASADESERSRRLAMPVVEAMSRAGLSRLWVPRSLGGAEADIAAVVQVVEAVSKIDGAAGWCLTIAGNTSLPAEYLPSRSARDIFASDPLLVTAGSWAPFGQVVAVEGGYRATGLMLDERYEQPESPVQKSCRPCENPPRRNAGFIG
jgi:hypothetical protein